MALLSPSFWSSACLRDAVAKLARLLANGIVDWENIRILMSSHLDKCPWVRPIGIGEALKRILCKVMALATHADLEDVCSVTQLCSGLHAGMEGPFTPCESCLISSVGVVTLER